MTLRADDAGAAWPDRALVVTFKSFSTRWWCAPMRCCSGSPPMRSPPRRRPRTRLARRSIPASCRGQQRADLDAGDAVRRRQGIRLRPRRRHRGDGSVYGAEVHLAGVRQVVGWVVLLRNPSAAVQRPRAADGFRKSSTHPTSKWPGPCPAIATSFPCEPHQSSGSTFTSAAPWLLPEIQTTSRGLRLLHEHAPDIGRSAAADIS